MIARTISKTALLLGCLLTVTTIYSQKQNYVVDSIVDNYMLSGYANKHFVPKGKYKNDKRQGFWKDYEVTYDYVYIMNENSPKQQFGSYLFYAEGKFENGKRIGNWVFYVLLDKSFKKIKLKVVNYEDGIKNGPCTYYFPNGKIADKLKYINNQISGERICYYENGSLHAKQQYEHNKKNGVQEYYYLNGMLSSKMTCLNDSLNGEYNSFYANGNKQEISYFSNGKSIGKYQYYHENGQLWIEKIYENGLLMNVTGNYDSTGKERDKGTIKDGNGTVLFYTLEGKVYSIQTYENGKLIKEEDF